MAEEGKSAGFFLGFCNFLIMGCGPFETLAHAGSRTPLGLSQILGVWMGSCSVRDPIPREKGEIKAPGWGAEGGAGQKPGKKKVWQGQHVGTARPLWV